MIITRGKGEKPLEVVEKIILENRSFPWIVLSMGGCGIVAEGMISDDFSGYSHDIAFHFATQYIQRIGLADRIDSFQTPQLLMEMAERTTAIYPGTGLLCTTWQTVSNGVLICSLGTNSVFAVGSDSLHEVFLPHSINTFLINQGQPPVTSGQGRMPTHALGLQGKCRVEDIRIAHISLEQTTLAIIVDRRVADALLKQPIPREQLPSFLETWRSPGKTIRTSVLLSL